MYSVQLKNLKARVEKLSENNLIKKYTDVRQLEQKLVELKTHQLNLDNTNHRLEQELQKAKVQISEVQEKFHTIYQKVEKWEKSIEYSLHDSNNTQNATTIEVINPQAFDNVVGELKQITEEGI